MTTVLNDKLSWSRTRPDWQRDALRRLATMGSLTNDDIDELANLCKSKYGLSHQVQAVPLDATHLPAGVSHQDAVALQTLTHRTGVNALAPNQTITFGPALTVVYGANASGKSGYTRILKSACRARGAEGILGNVASDASPGRPAATIDFQCGSAQHSFAWDDSKTPNPLLSRVSVFDRYCASVYISKRTDVAFRPMGLDLFDKLSDASEKIKRVLEKERSALTTQEPNLPAAPEGTEVQKLISHLTSLTDPADVSRLATLTAEENKRLADLRCQITDLTSRDPQKTAQMLAFKHHRVGSLLTRIRDLATTLSDQRLQGLFSVRDRLVAARQVAKELRTSTFAASSLQGTGSAAWQGLWRAAEKFSVTRAYPGHGFPVTRKGARCVLCQQELGDEEARRLEQFREFLVSTVEQDYGGLQKEYEANLRCVAELQITDSETQGTLKEMDLEEPTLASALEATLQSAEVRGDRVRTALGEERVCPEDLPGIEVDERGVSEYLEAMKHRMEVLEVTDRTEVLDRLREEAVELEAREVLGQQCAEVLAEIERKKKIAAYDSCVKDTTTQAITRKSSELTRRVVTGALTGGFLSEVRALGFDHVEVEMVPSGGSRGVLYHKLQLRRAPNIEVSRVMSEGETRCLSIASFFAELRTASDHSAILFDDPVSSLDHNWRNNVIKRLVMETKKWQVVVFTHDVVFLLGLVDWSKRMGVRIDRHNLWKGPDGAGMADEDGPWTAMPVKKRIGVLKQKWQDADQLYRNKRKQEYDREAEWIYGKLRTAWERGLEEVLLAGTLERFRRSVQTQQVLKLSDIETRDCEEFDAGMSKCSTWLAGHDQAPADNAPIPGSEELERDIEALEQWVKRIRERRQGRGPG